MSIIIDVFVADNMTLTEYVFHVGFCVCVFVWGVCVFLCVANVMMTFKFINVFSKLLIIINVCNHLISKLNHDSIYAIRFRTKHFFH